MGAKEDEDIRYFIDLNLETREVIDWDYDHKSNLYESATKGLEAPLHRVFLTKGQFNKLAQRLQELGHEDA